MEVVGGGGQCYQDLLIYWTHWPVDHWSSWSVDSRWMFENRCYIHLRLSCFPTNLTAVHNINWKCRFWIDKGTIWNHYRYRQMIRECIDCETSYWSWINFSIEVCDTWKNDKYDASDTGFTRHSNCAVCTKWSRPTKDQQPSTYW